MEGWISLYRKIQESKIYPKGRRFTEFEAWIDLLLNANHSDQEVILGYNIYICKRGQQLRSQETLAKHWNWSKSKVRRTLHLFQKCFMIELKPDRKTTQITICNYDKYQSERTASEPQVNRKRTASDTQTIMNNNNNNDNNEDMSVLNFDTDAAYESKSNKIDINFAIFWDRYGKKLGDKKRCEKKWYMLTMGEQQKIIKILSAYLKTIKDKQYLPYPTKFLKERRWENEDLLSGKDDQLDMNGKPRPGPEYCLVKGEWTVL